MMDELYDKWDQILNGCPECCVQETDALNFVVEFEDTLGPDGPELVEVDVEDYASPDDEDRRLQMEETHFLAIQAVRKLLRVEFAYVVINGWPFLIPTRLTIRV